MAPERRGLIGGSEAVKMAYCTSGDCPRVIEVWDNQLGIGKVAVQTYRFEAGRVPDLLAVPASEQIGWMSWEDWNWFSEEMARRRRPKSLGDLLTGARRNILRLETLAQYRSPAEAEALAAFREGRPQPALSEAAVAWLERIRAAVAAGRRRQRVHVVSRPLTDYLRWELIHGYAHNAAVGEEILVADREGHPGLEDLTRDFYTLDGRVAVLMDYDEEGRLLAAWRTDDADVVHACRCQYETAVEIAVPLGQYLELAGLVEPVSA
jgi:Family of unknown function (DUF6879)